MMDHSDDHEKLDYHNVHRADALATCSDVDPDTNDHDKRGTDKSHDHKYTKRHLVGQESAFYAQGARLTSKYLSPRTRWERWFVGARC